MENPYKGLRDKYREGVIGKSIGYDWYVPGPITRLDRYAASAKSEDLQDQYFVPITLWAKIRKILIHGG